MRPRSSEITAVIARRESARRHRRRWCLRRTARRRLRSRRRPRASCAPRRRAGRVDDRVGRALVRPGSHPDQVGVALAGRVDDAGQPGPRAPRRSPTDRRQAPGALCFGQSGADELGLEPHRHAWRSSTPSPEFSNSMRAAGRYRGLLGRVAPTPPLHRPPGLCHGHGLGRLREHGSRRSSASSSCSLRGRSDQEASEPREPRSSWSSSSVTRVPRFGVLEIDPRDRRAQQTLSNGRVLRAPAPSRTPRSRASRGSGSPLARPGPDAVCSTLVQCVPVPRLRS